MMSELRADGRWFAWEPDAPGAMAFGPTQEEAERRAAEMAQEISSRPVMPMEPVVPRERGVIMRSRIDELETALAEAAAWAETVATRRPSVLEAAECAKRWSALARR